MNGKKLSEIKHGRILFIVDFILPLPLTAVMFYLWYQRTHSWSFSAYVLVLPLLFGYIIPGIGTNVLKLWSFTWKLMRVGNYFIHHGFMYAPYFALSLYLTFGSWEQFTMIQAITIAISNAFLQCFLTTWHDYWAVQSGMIEMYNKPFREGKSAAEIVLDYGPIGYALFGFLYAASCLLAYYLFIVKQSPSMGLFLTLIAGSLLLMGVSGMHYVVRERKNNSV